MQIFQTTSDGEMTKTKVVDLEKLCNCSWQHFHLKSSLKEKLWQNFLTFEIQILQTTSDGEMTKTKVVDLEKL
jgi:hypothetical protein